MLEIHCHSESKINPYILAQVVTQRWRSHHVVPGISIAFNVALALCVARSEIQEIKADWLLSFSVCWCQAVCMTPRRATLLRRVGIEKLRVRLRRALRFVFRVVVHGLMVLFIWPRLIREVVSYCFRLGVGWPSGPTLLLGGVDHRGTV